MINNGKCRCERLDPETQVWAIFMCNSETDFYLSTRRENTYTQGF
jgi:hypothetical protein